MIYLLVASWGLIPRFFFTVQPDWAVNAINNPQFLAGNALGLFVRKNASEKVDKLLMNCFATTSLVSSASLLLLLSSKSRGMTRPYQVCLFSTTLVKIMINLFFGENSIILLRKTHNPRWVGV